MPQCNAECACCYEIRPSVGQDGRGAASSEGDGRRVVERGRMPGTRSGLTFGMITCALLISTSGCSSSGNSTRDSTSPSSEPPSSSVSSRSSSPSPSPSWLPPDYGTVKPAVDAYVAFSALVDKAFRNPARVPASTFDKYLAGQAKQLFVSSLAEEKAEGKAYRGAPPIRRVRVVQNHMAESLKWAVLRDCAMENPADPELEYYSATGKPVPQKKHDPPAPYADTIKIFLINGQWTITQFTVDSTRTCKP